jgi:hypothetical protein
MHIALNPEDGILHAAEMTTNAVDDAAGVKPVLEKIKTEQKNLVVMELTTKPRSMLF